MASLMPQAKQQYFDSDGNPLAGGKVYTYAAGTTTPLATYTTAAAGTPNANPVILDSRGEASIFFGSSNYKIVVTTAADAAVWTQDNLTGDAAASALALLAASSGSSLVGFIQSGTGAVSTTVQAKLRESVSVKDFGAVGDGVTDDTAAIQAAITAAGVGGRLSFFGTHVLTSTIRPLSSQTWVGASGCDFYFTATSSSPGVEFTSSSNFASVENIGFRATTGFTGSAFKFNASLSCRIDRVFIRNILNAKGVELSGGAFYNEARNVKVTSCLFGLYVTGTSPNCPNNTVIDNFDVYGSSGVGTAMFSDSNCSLFSLRNFISEATCTVNVLNLSAGVFSFHDPRFECPTTPSGGFYAISGATVLFTGKTFPIQKATHTSLTSDFDELAGTSYQNLVIDPLFIGDFPGGATPPTGWTVFSGTVSSITKSTNTPAVGMFGSSMEVVSSAATSGVSYGLSTAAVQALMRGKTAKLHALTYFTAPGTSVTAFIRQDGGAAATQQVSENLVAGQWAVHSCSLQIPSDAVNLYLRFLFAGNLGTFRIWSPVLEIDGAMYTFTKGGLSRVYYPNGIYAGANGNQVDLASVVPASGTWKRGDRVFNQLPTVGQPKGWICTVGGTPGTWVSEGNL